MSAFLALLAVAAPASAPDSVSLRKLHDLGACIVDQSPRTAREVLAMDYRAPEYAEKLKAIGARSSGCLARASQFRSSGVLFAGSLAEALIKFDHRAKELPKRIAYDPARPAIEARGSMEEMSLCTVLRAPEPTLALLATEPATAKEDEALAPLGPVLGQCLSNETKLQINKPAIRALLALAAYRIASAPKDAQ